MTNTNLNYPPLMADFIMGKYTVYMHTNKINGMAYIGITSKQIEQRWLNGSGYNKNSYFRKAIKKYGWDEFKHEVLFTGLTREEACKAEMELIAKYNTADGIHGYNLTFGGELNIHNAYTRKKISESKIGCKNPMFGKTPSAETIRKRCISQSGERNGMFGRKQSDETKEKIRDANKGRIHSEASRKNMADSHKVKVINLNTMQVFNSTKDASISINLTSNVCISNCCHGKQKTSGKDANGKPIKWMHYEEFLKLKAIV
jgi:group I intron endonuclease